MARNGRFRVALGHRAFHDGLTGLPNRAPFRERVGHALSRRSQAGAPLALLFIDLDDFKTVNDQLGHAAGDDLLAAVAGRLTTRVRGEDTVARPGGDEFAILLEQSSSHEIAVGWPAASWRRCARPSPSRAARSRSGPASA
jgi:diguanylate cyclase